VFDVCFDRAASAHHSLSAVTTDGVRICVDIAVDNQDVPTLDTPIALTLIHNLNAVGALEYIEVPEGENEPLYEDIVALAAKFAELDKKGTLPKIARRTGWAAYPSARRTVEWITSAEEHPMAEKRAANMKMKKGTRYYRRKQIVTGYGIAGIVSFPPNLGRVTLSVDGGVVSIPLDDLTPSSRRSLISEPVSKWNPSDPELFGL